MQYFKLWKVTKEYAIVKRDVKDFHEENKKIRAKIRIVRFGRVSNTYKKDKDSLQNEIDHWKCQVKEAKKKAAYWENMHSSTFEKLTRCLEDRER